MTAPQRDNPSYGDYVRGELKKFDRVDMAINAVHALSPDLTVADLRILLTVGRAEISERTSFGGFVTEDTLAEDIGRTFSDITRATRRLADTGWLSQGFLSAVQLTTIGNRFVKDLLKLTEGETQDAPKKRTPAVLQMLIDKSMDDLLNDLEKFGASVKPLLSTGDLKKSCDVDAKGGVQLLTKGLNCTILTTSSQEERRAFARLLTFAY